MAAKTQQSQAQQHFDGAEAMGLGSKGAAGGLAIPVLALARFT